MHKNHIGRDNFYNSANKESQNGQFSIKIILKLHSEGNLFNQSINDEYYPVHFRPKFPSLSTFYDLPNFVGTRNLNRKKSLKL